MTQVKLTGTNKWELNLDESYSRWERIQLSLIGDRYGNQSQLQATALRLHGKLAEIMNSVQISAEIVWFSREKFSELDHVERKVKTEEITVGQAHVNTRKQSKYFEGRGHLSQSEREWMYVNTWHLLNLLIEKDSRDRQNISIKFPCACPMVISSVFGKSFHFPFLYFVLFSELEIKNENLTHYLG